MLAMQVQSETLESLKLLFAIFYLERNRDKECTTTYVDYFIQSLQTEPIPAGLMMAGGP